MGKLLMELQRQCKHSDLEIKKAGEDCLAIYNILSANTQHVWSSDWNVLTTVEFEGIYPNNHANYYPSRLGNLILKGCNYENKNIDY